MSKDVKENKLIETEEYKPAKIITISNLDDEKI